MTVDSLHVLRPSVRVGDRLIMKRHFDHSAGGAVSQIIIESTDSGIGEGALAGPVAAPVRLAVPHDTQDQEPRRDR